MSNKPQIIYNTDFGIHNGKSQDEKDKKGSWRDLRTIILIPCYSKGIHPRIVENWSYIMSPMNQAVVRIFMTDMEVGQAYTQAIEMILQNPILKDFPFIATLEHDNLVQPDWLLKTYEDMDKFDVVGTIYYTKGEYGKPMCYGDPNAPYYDMQPFEPKPNDVTPCNGLGMGATVFKSEIFKNTLLQKPYFETKQEFKEGVGAKAYTQDLYFFENARKLGYKFGCTTKTKCGHLDLETGIVW